jgi:sec-independent protein translocase protein TatC
MKIAFFVGIFVVAPYLLYQVWAFIAPGLYAHEKTYAVPFILFGSVFFILGGLFGHYILFPMTFQFLGQYAGTEMSFKPKISAYFDFYSWFLLGLGVCFQLPVVIFVLSRIGLVTARFLLRWFKYAFLVAFVVSAVITPGGDIVTQSVLAIPLVGLYLLGILIAWIFGKPRRPPQPAQTGVSAGE